MAVAKDKTIVVKKEKPSSQTAIVSYEEEMAAYAAEVADQVKPPSGGSISFKGGLHIDGQRMEDDKAPIIVLDFGYENNFYIGDYNADDVQSPVCFAFGKKEDELKPHPESGDPQAESCSGCPHNEWGSAEKGKGKACQNRRRLIAMSANYDDADQVKEAPLKRAKLPVTSGKNWDGYATGLAREMTGPRYVITEIQAKTGGKNMVDVFFKRSGFVDPEMIGAVKERLGEARDLLNAPYPKNEEKPADAKPAKGAAKYAGKKK